ncbi:hypothetical protein ACFY0G_02070 [Streptomyces sp. NPDC001552]|uniref:hypothetical protein n=1 Tax=Streptomyces sp. NPDC001552 TaxID=3364587 RepID=UPI0036A7D481
MEITPEYVPALEQWHLADDEAGIAWHMLPMLTTWALTGTRPDDPAGCYSYRWCFSDQRALLAAVDQFDPATMDEPSGHVKRKGERRQAPNRDAHPEYNRDRCAHGKYVADGDCRHVACEAWTFAPARTP